MRCRRRDGLVSGVVSTWTALRLAMVTGGLYPGIAVEVSHDHVGRTLLIPQQNLGAEWIPEGAIAIR